MSIIAPGDKLGPAKGILLACSIGLLFWGMILVIYLSDLKHHEQ
jgi:hypothetical protein